MKFEIAEDTQKYILKQYPHLSEQDIKFLFIKGKIVECYVDLFNYPDNMYVLPKTYELHIQSIVAKLFNVDQVIPLVEGRDGWIYTQYLE